MVAPTRIILVLLITGFAITRSANAELMYEYTGDPFTVGLGNFSPGQFITGTATFNPDPAFPTSVGASAFSLSVSGPGSSFTIDDTTPGLTVLANLFIFDGTGEITFWNLHLSADVIGGAAPESILTALAIDRASEDGFVDGLGSVTGTSHGEWSLATSSDPQPVPEPSSILVWVLLGACGCILVWRRQSSKPSQANI